MCFKSTDGFYGGKGVFLVERWGGAVREGTVLRAACGALHTRPATMEDSADDLFNVAMLIDELKVRGGRV